MTRLLVSVRTVEEAALALACGAGLVDAKDPSAGALGALPLATVAAIHRHVAGRAATSAVAGEADAVEALLGHASAMAGTGVDFVKIGLAGRLTEPGALRDLGRGLPEDALVVAVLAAEDGPAHAMVAHLAAAGFAGAMIDTRGKAGARLTSLQAPEQLRRFVAACRSEGLFCGLAGSLHVADIAALAPLGADYLGFRGGVCVDGRRTGPLDARRIEAAAQALAIHADAPGDCLALPETT